MKYLRYLSVLTALMEGVEQFLAGERLPIRLPSFKYRGHKLRAKVVLEYED